MNFSGNVVKAVKKLVECDPMNLGAIVAKAF